MLPFNHEALYRLRSMVHGEESRLHEIDRQAAGLFAAVAVADIAAIADRPSMPLAQFVVMLSGCTVIVACHRQGLAVGFIAADRVGDDLFVRELSVAPDHGRRGVGSALLRAIISHGRQNALRACLLSTFRDVAFNAPFYRKHGFAELPLADASPAIRQRFQEEIPAGIRPGLRLLMINMLDQDSSNRD